MLKKLLILLNCLSINKSESVVYVNVPANNAPVTLSFDDIQVFRTYRGDSLYRKDASIVNGSGKSVILLDANGIPVNQEGISSISYSNQFGVLGNLRLIKEFNDVNNNTYYISNVNGTYNVYDRYSRVVILLNKNGSPIKI